MGREKIGRNQPCPCGSGRKYKHCCFGKNFDFVEGDDGAVYQEIPITDDLANVLHEQRKKFREVHGRDPGPNDKVFFDAPPYEVIEHGVVQAMRETGCDPAKVNAFIETGIIPTDVNLNQIPTAELDRWTEVVRRYEAEHGESLPPLPWTRTEWEGMQQSDLKNCDAFFDYIQQLRDELFASRGSCDRYFCIIELLLLVTAETDLDLIDDAWIAEHRQDLRLNEETLRRILEVVIHACPEQELGYRGAFELGAFAEDFVAKAQQQIEAEDDTEINELREFARSVTLMRLVVGINKHFGLIE